jgi:hypothetical protein
MPGEKEYLKAFSENLKPKVLGQLLEIIFEKMELAGEAGSLLKIEEEIADSLEKAREEFNKELLRRKDEAGYLPGMASKIQQRSLFDFADLPDKTQFWQTAEENILETLRNYAEEAEQEIGCRLRLFAEDAAKGFAFIDLCRKLYDVVVMNPPFGLAPRIVFDKHKKLYADSYVELYAQMVTRGDQLLIKDGRIGAISSRSFMTISRLRQYRRKMILPGIDLLADLGASVMDDAFVESVAYVISRRALAKIIAIDLREKSEPQPDLLESIKRLEEGNRTSNWKIKNRTVIAALPGSKLLYSLPIRVHELFESHNVLEPDIATVRQGMGTFNDFRFLRLRHEVSVLEIGRNGWEPLAKGGAFSFYYSDIHLLLNWKNDGAELSAVNIAHNGQDAQVRQASGYWRRSGSTYSKRSQKGFSVRALPAKCIFAGKGPAILSQSDVSPAYLLGWINSRFIRWIIEIQANDHEYNTGIVKKVPWIEGHSPDHKLVRLIEETLKKLQLAQAITDTNSCFIPILSVDSLKVSLDKWIIILKDAEASLSRTMADWDAFVDKLYGVDSCDLQLDAKDEILSDSEEEEDEEIEENVSDVCDCLDNAINILVGFVFGRWDIRIGINHSLAPRLPDPFDSLPICSPGMLITTDGLPAKADLIVSEEWLCARPDVNSLPPEGVVLNPTILDSNYPLRISWSGIIVDDEGHTEDIVTRVLDAIEVIWKDKANDIEQEACEILGVRSLREYLAKPAKFFADHLKRYSKSRRQAPIYWPLSTPSGSYTLWLYYHRLTDQTLYTCVNNFVGPKFKQVAGDAERLRKKSNRSSEEEKVLEKLSDLSLELKDFHDELLRIAGFWKPNLNDGVQITAAPLWKLFQHKPWQTKLKQTWKDLETGKYDWARLAYSIWPERVIRASHKDRSYAIAHDLEDDLWEEVETGTDRQGNPKTKWVPKDLGEKGLKQLIAQKIGGKA